MRLPAYRQRGVAALMAVLFLLFILGTVLMIAHQMAATDVHDSYAQNRSVEALMLAESGLERATQRYGAGIVCGAGLMEGAISYGGGEFEVIAPTPYLSGGRCVARIQGRVGNVSRTIEAQFVGGGAGIAFDRVTTRTRNNDNAASWNHRVTTANPNPVLIVGVILKNTGSPAQTVASVTYNGVALTSIGTASTATPDVRVELWRLINPSTGANYPVVVTLSGASTAIIAGAVSLTGVHQATPIEASTFNRGSSGTASVSVTTVSGNAWVMDVMGSKTDGGANIIAAVGRVERWNQSAGTGGGANRIRGTASTRGPIAAAGAVTMNWTLSSSRPWAMGAVAIKPATAGQVLTWTEIVN
jgi:hypothetical protein